MRVDAGVVGRRLTFRDDAHLPRRVLIPDHPLLVGHDDVGFPVGVDVSEDHAVADLQAGVDFLGFEGGDLR